jgi:hypothetical protein
MGLGQGLVVGDDFGVELAEISTDSSGRLEES